ncbi:hypothetical protein NEMBOFW57_006788 [Staphylotrichum longicolle]|uniref:Protein kinase domain-containing protein n=1 Tax=Staphylotrichum longicolle TaxID=669026 RepID=A0AAD4HXS4_9PEZI|nr:hypothetical protein NEMBOFW57_006788 [Staphylotrichum longicolle]
MSPVMEVSIKTASGPEFRAVLKLYDRRFGRNFREIYGKYAPHTEADEVVSRSFVRQGKMAPFLRMLEHDKKTADIAVRSYRYHDSTPEGKAKFEAALWQECIEHFECETEAYARLRELQAKLIPHMHAHQWPAIIQAAADAAHQINKRGVLMEDGAPRNVMVETRLQKPFIIDLAQCLFKDKMLRRWLENGYADDDDGWDPEAEYWERARQHGNPAAIGVQVERTNKKDPQR